MSRSLPYRVSKKSCYFKAPHRQHFNAAGQEWVPCKGTPIIWPAHSLTETNTPTCERHARLYFGDSRIDVLIRINAIKVWKLSQEITGVQMELPLSEKENDEWQNLSQ
jgi:hypothetical protein